MDYSAHSANVGTEGCPRRAGAVLILAQALLLSGCTPPSAPPPTPARVPRTDVRVTVTADNKYALYQGSLNGDHLEFIGRNEVGRGGDWEKPEEYSLSLNQDDYPFFLAWDWGGPQMLIAQLELSDGTKQVSSRSDWLCAAVDIANPGASGSVPALQVVSSVIHSAEWTPPAESAPNGTAPWGSIPKVSPSAQFIWPDGFASSVESDKKVALCRPDHPPGALGSKSPRVPE